MPGASKRWRDSILQALLLAALLAILGTAIQTAAANLERQGIASGFAFLERRAGFAIAQHLIPYTEDSSYGAAFVVGLLNTLLVSALGCFLATGLGFGVGIARLSPNPVLSRLGGIYVEIMRNVPVLLQVFFWYFAVLRQLPGPRESLSLFGLFFLNVRGLSVPRPYWPEGGGLHWEIPELSGFNFTGGWVLMPELVALTLALSLYTAAYIAEIVRAGIMAVPRGQREAAAVLGLSRVQVMRYIVLPQALRLIIPPLSSQYLNLTKNSSLAAAIAYPDLVLVFAGTVLMQTGQAVEIIAVTMGVYLCMSLVISLFMNLYHFRIMRRGG